MVAPDHFYMELHAPELANKALPGQFLHVKVSDGLYPLLRRPISLHVIDREQGILGLLYQVRGKGTQILSKRLAGENIDVLGPLGKEFNLNFSGNNALIVGGGIGIAPLFPLAKSLVEAGKNVTVILGARTAHMVLSQEKFSSLGCNVKIATDDGTAGIKGFVTELLQQEILAQKVDYVYACGPEMMLAKVEEICLSNNISGQVSLEAYMGCGVGACLSCACERNHDAEKKYAKVCTEGPVFSMGEVKLHD